MGNIGDLRSYLSAQALGRTRRPGKAAVVTAEQVTSIHPAVLIVEPDYSPARQRILAAVHDAGLVARMCPEVNTALRHLEESLAGDVRVVTATLGPFLTSPVAAAHRLRSRVPTAELIFLTADAHQAEAMRRSLAFDPILGRYWSVLPLDDPATLVDALRRITAREQFRQSADDSANQDGPEPMTMRPESLPVSAPLASDRYLASLLRQAQDAIVALGPNGAVVAWNDAASALFGFSATEAVGNHLWALASAADQALWQRWFRQAREGLALRRELAWHRPNGTTCDVEVSFAPVHDHAREIVGVSVIARDVSDRRRTEAALREVGRLKDQFLAIVSHELRTPLTTVLGYATMLRRRVERSPGPPNREQVLRATEAILRAGQHLSQLIDDLLDVSQAQQGLIELQFAPCDLGKLVTEVVARLHDTPIRAPQSRLNADTIKQAPPIPRIVVSLPDDPMVGEWDARRLDQIVTHLITNALRCSPDGSQVLVRIARDGEQALLDVQDFGVGIAIEEQARIFEPFFRTGATSSLSGLGLGLFLSREIVHGHGGEIWVDSEPGRGTTMHVRLPLRPSESRDAHVDVQHADDART